MLERAHERHRQYLELRLSLNDGQGCVPIVMGYMDYVNAIVHIEDEAFFMNHFKRTGLPLGAVLDQEKTRVMTSPHLRATGEELSQMIREISTQVGVPHEITDGIRMLGTPVENATFSRHFISQAMDKVREHSKTILYCLHSRQSALCTTV